YFRQEVSGRSISQKNAITEDPLYEPLRKIGGDGPGIRRLLTQCSRSVVQRWVNITDAAMHEHPKGFAGFRVSPAAFLMDGVQHRRTMPDWMCAHEKRVRADQWKQEGSASAPDELERRQRFEQERTAA